MRKNATSLISISYLQPSFLLQEVFVTGYCGENAIEEAQCDMIVECIRDMVNGLTKLRYDTDEDKKVRSGGEGEGAICG